MATILSDEILSNLNCSICKQYLSFGPTKIHSNKVISCGRCNTNETTSPNSLYEKVARFTFFPCINRYDGCNKLLQYKDVPQHEKLCKGTKIMCPICPSEHANEISLLCLIDHYKNFHTEYFLCESKFVIDPNINFDSTYLYCDNLNNCLFFITIRSTQDRLFLNASVSGQKKVVQRFRLNNSLLEPNTIRLCTLFPETDHQFEVKIQEEPMEIYNHISCEFLYEVMEKTLPMIIATDLNFSEPEKRERTFRKMPKLFMDAESFPGKHKFKLSACKSRLIDEYDDKFNVKLKCDFCKTYYWNIPKLYLFRLKRETTENTYYDLTITSEDIICSNCKRYFVKRSFNFLKLFEYVTLFSIIKLRFYCRHYCGTLWPIAKLASHEEACSFNLETDSDTFVKKCFGNILYDTEDKFIIGNIVPSFCLTLDFYPFAIFGPDPKIPTEKDISLSEKVIYVINDDGFRLKIFLKLIKGDTFMRIEHDFDKNKYFMGFRTTCFPWDEVIIDDCSSYRPVNLFATFMTNRIDTGIEHKIKFQTFIVYCKKNTAGSIVTF